MKSIETYREIPPVTGTYEVREHMTINTTEKLVTNEISGFYQRPGGNRHSGWHVLNNAHLLDHPEKLARIAVGQISPHSKVAALAHRIGDAVSNITDYEMSNLSRFHVGLFLLSAAERTGEYGIRRDDKHGSPPDPKVMNYSREPYRIYATGAHQLLPLGYTSVDQPFPKWSNAIDHDGRRLSSSNCLTPEVDTNMTWVRAVNNLERVGYRVNPTMLEVVNALGIRTANVTKSIQQAEVLSTANALADDPFYLRAHVDGRGRIYTSRSVLNYQQGDLSRGLLEFAEGVPLTEEGVDAIYLHLANSWGIKGDITDRIKVGREHHEQWIRYATDPVGTASNWLDVDDPWQLLRACIELTTIKVGDLSNIIIPIDMSCSGLALQSIIMNDPNLAKMTNLLGGFHDLYTLIGDTLKLPAEPSERRKIIKQIVMPKSYGGGAKTLGMDLRDWAELNPKSSPYLNTLDMNLYVYVGKGKDRHRVEMETTTAGKPIKEHKNRKRYVSKDFEDIARDAISALNTMASSTLEYAESVKRFYKSRLDSGLPHIQWLSPSGFVCRARKDKTIKINGSLRLRAGTIGIVSHQPTGEIDTGRMITASLANIVHSLDASLVHFALAHSDYQIVPVHDSFGSHSSNVWKMQTQLMETLAFIESMDPSLTLSAQDHGTDVSWSDLQAQQSMQDYLQNTTTNKTPVVDTNATNVFS